MTRVTKHAQARMRERIGLPKRAVQRVSDRAYEHGMDASETKGYLKKWTRHLLTQNKTVKIYGNYVFIYDEITLITVLYKPSREKLCYHGCCSKNHCWK